MREFLQLAGYSPEETYFEKLNQELVKRIRERARDSEEENMLNEIEYQEENPEEDQRAG